MVVGETLSVSSLTYRDVCSRHALFFSQQSDMAPEGPTLFLTPGPAGLPGVGAATTVNQEASGGHLHRLMRLAPAAAENIV